MNVRDRVVFDSVARQIGLARAPDELDEFLPEDGLFKGRLMIIGIALLIGVAWIAAKRRESMDDLGGGPL